MKPRKLKPAGGETYFSPKGNWIELTVPSEELYLQRLETVRRDLDASRVEGELVDQILYALDEVVRNAMEWGNLRESSRKVKINYALFPRELVIKVEDEGTGFRHQKLPNPSVNPVAVQDIRQQLGKRSGGFGLHLVRKMMDEVIFNETGNVVLLVKRLPL